MNTEDIEVDQLYEVPDELKEHHFPAGGSPWRLPGHPVPGRVLEKGLPYGKRGIKAGVRIEFTIKEMRRCETCGHGWQEDENGRPIYDDEAIEAVIPASMILGRWDQRELRQDLLRMQTLEWFREQYPEDQGDYDITPEAVIEPDRGRPL